MYFSMISNVFRSCTKTAATIETNLFIVAVPSVDDGNNIVVVGHHHHHHHHHHYKGRANELIALRP